jgi:hypothetical protein
MQQLVVPHAGPDGGGRRRGGDRIGRHDRRGRRRGRRAEDRAPRRHRSREPDVRQLLQPLLHCRDRLQPDVHAGSLVLRDGARARSGLADRADDAERRAQRRARPEPPPGVRAHRDRRRQDGRLRHVERVRVAAELRLRRRDGAVVLGPRREERAGGPLFPARRRGELLERPLPRTRTVRLSRRHVRAGGDRLLVLPRRADHAVHRHDHRRSPREGRGDVVLVRRGLRRDGAGGEERHLPAAPRGLPVRFADLPVPLRPG